MVHDGLKKSIFMSTSTDRLNDGGVGIFSFSVLPIF